jgi:hypothetical protein
MIRMSVGNKDHRDLLGRPANLLQVALELRSRPPNARVDQADLLTQEDIRIDKPVCIMVLAQGQPEMVLKGMNGLCDFHPRFSPLMVLIGVCPVPLLVG